MAPGLRTRPLSVCIARCAELIRDLSGIPQFQSLQQQVNFLLSSLLSMTRTLPPTSLATSASDPAYSPGLSLLAAYLNELRKTCESYGVGAQCERHLGDQERAFVLGEIDNPFNNIANILFLLAQALQGALVGGEHTDHRTNVEKLCEWAESTFTYWNSLQGEFETARALARVTSAERESQPTTHSPSTSGGSVDYFSAQSSPKREPQQALAWDKIGEQLAEEGIEDDAIANVANDLKECARSLIRGERPRFALDERQLAETAPKNSNTPASSKPKPFSGASTEPPAKMTKASAEAKPKAADAATVDWFNPVFVAARVTSALARAKIKFEAGFPGILEIASKQEHEKDCRNLCRVLDLIYTTACRDTGCSRLHARLARDLQKNTPERLRDIMASERKGDEAAGNDANAVSNYLFQKCSRDWDHGKNGKDKIISVENFALGLSRFIGDLAKFGVFNAGQVHDLIRMQLGPTLKRNQFMAVYKLLRTAGPMLDSLSEKSDMEDHFKQISSLRDKKKTPETVKDMAQELSSLRNSGWKNKPTKVLYKVEGAIRQKK